MGSSERLRDGVYGTFDGLTNDALCRRHSRPLDDHTQRKYPNASAPMRLIRTKQNRSIKTNPSAHSIFSTGRARTRPFDVEIYFEGLFHQTVPSSSPFLFKYIFKNWFLCLSRCATSFLSSAEKQEFILNRGRSSPKISIHRPSRPTYFCSIPKFQPTTGQGRRKEFLSARFQLAMKKKIKKSKQIQISYMENGQPVSRAWSH